METARFQLVEGVRAGDRLDPPWPVVETRRTATPDLPGTRWYGWRLLSRNHRDLARSPAVYASEAECLSAIERFRRSAAGARTELARNPHTGRWTWVLGTDTTTDTTTDAVGDADGDPAGTEAGPGVRGGALATGSRGYLRRRECHDCVTQVVELATTALDPPPDDALPRRTLRRV